MWSANILGMDTAEDVAAELNAVITQNVRAEIARAGMTQTTLAPAIRKDRSWIADRMTNRAAWRATDIHLIAEALGVATAVLLPPANLTEES